jgi:hypothetical protein
MLSQGDHPDWVKERGEATKRPCPEEDLVAG